MRLFNTMTREKDLFKPLADPVTMYVCGVTPYDTTHMGHARTYMTFDVLQRYLQHLGHSVRYVQNVTDVDDPLIERANSLGIGYQELAAHYVEIFLTDLAGLNILAPTVYPRATEEIPGMLETISVLMEKDMAYARKGSVYFRAARFPDFGAMSRLTRDEMLTLDRETGESPDDPNKDDWLDFRLWQAAQPNEPVWDSPWGSGRPGWHIECSTMANRYLGPRIDIHGGGADLVFPHHCSEIAQSETANGVVPFCGYWVHVGLVWMDGEKMSKSLGNMAFARDLLPVYGGDAIRFYLLETHYRERLEYRESDLVAASDRFRGVTRVLQGAREGHPSPAGAAAGARFAAAMEDDLDTPTALTALEDLAGVVAAHDSPGDRLLLESLLQTLGFRLD
jgi:L-cysteine:1D-myo-inositol 2-amino-2-deoxy-alpha-D-glucopyranoside ligase